MLARTFVAPFRILQRSNHLWTVRAPAILRTVHHGALVADSLELIHTVEQMQAHAEGARARQKTLSLVPTMGALHRGHEKLIEHAASISDHVTVSIFVNPTQFAPGEDYAAYPRTLETDLNILDSLGGVDVVFAPSVKAMYPFGLPPYATTIVRELGDQLCGAFRIGHFDGVTSVVSKLFLACHPHKAVFGQKDAQQLAIIRRMTAEMGFGIDIVGHPIVRNQDGLALSSRNAYLSAEQRKQATVLSRALFGAAHRISQGERDVRSITGSIREQIDAAPLVELQYAEVVDAVTLQPVETLMADGPSEGRYLVAVAAFLGSTRLIDNVQIDVGPDA